MTRREAYEKHKALWNEIAKMIDKGIKYNNPETYKSEALERLGYYDYTFNNCYACEVTKCCSDCLVVWKFATCMYQGSEYMNFIYEVEHNNYDSAKEYARKIANLPLREGFDIDKDIYEDDYEVII